MVWYSYLLKNFPQSVVIHTVKGFGIVNKADIDVFLEFSCFFDDPTDVVNLISGSYAVYKSSLNIWKSSVHILLKPGLENFEHYFASMGFPIAQLVKNLPAIQETRVCFLGQEDPLKRMATHSTILAWRIPWAEEPGGLQSRHDLATKPPANQDECDCAAV